MKNLLVALLLCSTCLTSPSKAQTNKTSKMSVNYASSPWNKSSTEVDSAFMFIRDQNSGQTVKILLDETEPDSSIFSGQFSVNWVTSNAKPPHVYIPPQQLRNDPKAIERFNSLLKTGKIKPRPLMIRTNKMGYTLEVYDTQEQATRAKVAYNKELSASKNEEQTKLVKPQAEETDLQVAKTAQHAAMVAQLAVAAAKQETDRIRLEQLELQKREERLKAQQKLERAEIEAKKTKAKSLSNQAIEHYKKNEYAEASSLFEKAMELDPNAKSFYFMYGISQYRLEKFNEALVALKMAGSNPNTDVEKKYYIGLIHYRLKELASARATFAEVKTYKDPELSPSAGFYEGLVYFAEENLEKALASFEYVLDTSKDPALDNKAEEYIEKISNLIQYKKMAAKKIFLSAELGLNYDSNILYVPDAGSTGSINNKGGARTNIAGTAEYRFFYKESSEFSTKLNSVYTRSFSTDFVQADPLTFTLTGPYTLKGLLNGKGTRLALSPGYESVLMDFDSSGQQSNILNTIMLNSDLMIVMKDDWFSNYTLDIRSDDSLLPGATGTTADADAMKVGFTKSETLFLDATKKRALTGSLGYVLNNAKGDEKKYNRFEFSASLTAPWSRFKNTTWNTGLNMYMQNYSSSIDDRKDTNMMLSLGANKIFNEEWSWSNTLGYTNNTSNIEASDYSKYTVLSTVHYAWSK